MNISGALQLGFIYSFLALGVYVSFRVMNIPDLTADGSFTLGMSISSLLALNGHPLWALVLGMAAGAAAGIVTGLFQTKAGIHPILAGILTMTGLYSVNLFIMGGSPNISLLGKENLFTIIYPLFSVMGKNNARLVSLFLLSAAAVCVLAWFFRTGLGLRIRAAGNNEQMVRSSSINTGLMKIIALALANAFIAFSGAVLAQYQGYGDINAGTGIVIIGLASVILGELLPCRISPGLSLASAAVGAVAYRLLIASALYFNVFPAYMFRLLSACIVALALSAPSLRRVYGGYRRRKRNRHHAGSR
ncbi:MAG: ABC transporter permease [Spirochaetaceae bacterium]|jgi:putative ABC transport system permease protein|nr:ABC transporter permease [Spirochaetaceae bacterium]